MSGKMLSLGGLCLSILGLGFAAVAQQVAWPDRPPRPLLVVHGAEKPVSLQSMQLRTEISGSLAQTTVDLVLHNPNARQLEGEFQFPLASGQQVATFALDIAGAMREAGSARRRPARTAWRDEAPPPRVSLACGLAPDDYRGGRAIQLLV